MLTKGESSIMKLMFLGILGALVLGSAAIDNAEGASIYTGTKGGAYESTFCPPIPDALEGAAFYDYNCTESNGTVDNIAQVLANPGDIGLAQLDVFSRQVASDPTLNDRLVIVREVACEALLMVTKNERLNGFADVLSLARRVPFIVGPEGSGGKATFEYLKSIDKNLGYAKNVTSAKNTAAIIDAVSSGGRGEIGFFVQFLDPTNSNVQKIIENDLKVIPVISRALVNAEFNGSKIYQVQTFELEGGGIFSDPVEITTSCTPVVIFTTNPSSIIDEGDRLNQIDLVAALQDIPSEDLLPKEPFLAKIISGAKKLTDSAIEEIVAGVEKGVDLIDDQL
jgi:hypothetical protein